MNVVTEYIFARRRHIHGQQVIEKGLDTTKHHEMQIKIPPHTYENCWCCSITKFCLTLWPHWLQHDKLLHSPLCPRVCSNKYMPIEVVILSNHLILCCPLLVFPSICSSIRFFEVSQFFTWGGQSIGVSASASVLSWIFRVNFLQDWLIWSPCSPRNSQESSPAPQSESTKSLVLSLLYGSVAMI